MISLAFVSFKACFMPSTAKVGKSEPYKLPGAITTKSAANIASRASGFIFTRGCK